MAEQPEPQGTPPQRTDANLGVSCAFKFVGQEDKNISMVWPGQLPRLGDNLKLKGRDTVWVVTRVDWLLDIQFSKKTMDRGVMITLEEEKEPLQGGFNC